MATDIEKLFAEITNGLDLLKPKQVEIVAAHVYKQQITALTKEALKDFKDRTKKQQEWEGFHARAFRQEVKINLQIGLKAAEYRAGQAVLVEVPVAVEEVVKKPFVFEFYDELKSYVVLPRG